MGCDGGGDECGRLDEAMGGVGVCAGDGLLGEEIMRDCVVL